MFPEARVGIEELVDGLRFGAVRRGVQPDRADRVAGRAGSTVLGMRCTMADVTFGGGVKAAGPTLNMIFASDRQPHSTPSRP